MAATIETTICQHLIDASLQLPFALYNCGRAARYLCMNCLSHAIEEQFKSQSESPSNVAASVHFDKCEHSPGQQICLRCLEAAAATLKARCGRLFYFDHQTANKLKRVVSLWNRPYYPNNVRQTAASVESNHPQEPVEESAEDRRIRRDAECIAARRQQILRERGFPMQAALGATGVQPHRVVIVPPSQH